MKHQETATQAYRRDRITVKGRLCILASTLCIGACVALGTVSTSAQSPTPFGVPVGLENPGTNLNGKTVHGTRLFGWGDQGRSEVVARHGMVATSHHLAAQAGLEILEMGGNAADAAVAAASILDVTSQNDTGLGGDLFVLYWSARDKKLYALNAAGWSPAGWTPAYFATRQLSGVNSITVPGAVAGFDALLKRFGTMTFKQTFERARQLSEEGFGVTERIHRDWAQTVNALRNDPDSRSQLLVNDNVPPLYSIFKNPNLAKAFRELQLGGRDAFYKGAIANAIVNKIQSIGGVMTLDDLAQYQALWVEPISTKYHGYDVFELPPPGQGFATLEQLNILEACVPQLGYDLATLGHTSPRFWHFLVESKKLAYADLGAYNGDPLFSNIPLDRLLVEVIRGDAVQQDQPGPGKHGFRTESCRGNDQSDDGRPVGKHGVGRAQRLQRVREPDFGARLWFRIARPRVGIHARSNEPQRRRPPQAAFPHHHHGVRDEGR